MVGVRILITGSAAGLGRLAAAELVRQGHHVIIHVRGRDRLTAVTDLVESGAEVVVGDLADLDQTRQVAEQANRLGPMHAVIHNAGVAYAGQPIMPVNVVAPYLLTALMRRPRRLVDVTTGLADLDRPRLADIDWTGHRPGSLPGRDFSGPEDFNAQL